MRRISAPLPLLTLVILLFAFWLFNFGPLQPVSRPVEDFGLWAHNLYNEFLPDYDYAFRRIREGRLPLWNPFQGGGIPTLAALQSGIFYPPNILFLLTSAENAIGYSTLFHLILAAVFTYLFFRRAFSGGSAFGASVAALGFVFNPRLYEFVLFPGNYMTACCLPMVLYLGQRLVSERNLRNAALLGMGVAMPLFAGFAQVAVSIYILLTLYLLFRVADLIFVERSSKDGLRLLGFCVISSVIALLIASPQLAPTLELVGISGRAPGTMTVEMSHVYSIENYYFSNWLRGVLAFPAKVRLVETWHPIPNWEIFLMLSAFGLFRRKNAKISMFFLIVGGVYFMLSLGATTPLYRLYWDYFPIGDWFTAPIRLRIIPYFCFALLAGNGADLLWQQNSGEWEALKGLLLRLGLILLVSCLMIVACLAIQFEGAGLACLLIGVHCALISAFCILRWMAPETRRSALATVLLGFIVVECFISYANGVPFPGKVKPKENIYSRTVANSLDLPDKGERVHIENGWGIRFFGLPTVPEKFGMLFEVPVTTNWEPLNLRSYQDYCNYLTGHEWLYGRFQIAGRPYNKKMFDALGVRRIVFSDDGKDWIFEGIRTGNEAGRYRLLKDLGQQRIYENLKGLDRVNFAESWEVMTGKKKLFRRMREGSFEPEKSVLLIETPPSLPPYDPTSQGTISAGNPIQSFDIGYQNVQIEVAAPVPGIVWISDSYYPGWKVLVDGIEKDLLRVNYAFRGVFVEKGRHEVEMVFRPRSYRLGLTLGAFGLVITIIMLVAPRQKPGDR